MSLHTPSARKLRDPGIRSPVPAAEAAAAMASSRLFLLLVFFISSSFRLSVSQNTTAATPAPAANPEDLCNGIYLTYALGGLKKIHPFRNSTSDQPYSFAATATIQNNGPSDYPSWSFLAAFRHRELIVSVSPAVLTDGFTLPYSTPNNGTTTSFSGFPSPDLKTAIDTAGDINQYRYTFTITGTLFGPPPAPASPLPSSISLDDPSYICSPSPIPTGATVMQTCCTPDPNFMNATAPAASPEPFLPRRPGDLSISYDVIQSYGSSYLALVKIENQSPLGRLDNWHLSWDWMRGEFIYSMRGAYTDSTDANGCIFGPQSQFYQDLDFSKVMNCERSPTILDLPIYLYNDTNVGRIPSCCRNGTVLPAVMDPSQSSSAFQMQVYKMPPDLNRTKLFPPQNFKIRSPVLDPVYQCFQPQQVSPSEFPDPSGLQTSTVAVASWQIVCNITAAPKPKCCVSFSAYYNDSVVPCNTCACGCPAASTRRTCNAAAPAMLLPSNALLVPFDNRTVLARAWASQNHLAVPNPLPCPDNCGVSINWHIATDFTQGWSARMTLFNWGEVAFPDWFAAVVMPKAYDGYQAMYSFNGTAMGNDTIFMKGNPGLNYLVAEAPDVANGGPDVPGKQQSVISFTKKTTPGIDIAAGDGFPAKVFFNGEECSVPDYFPSGGGSRLPAGSSLFISLVVLLATVFVLC